MIEFLSSNTKAVLLLTAPLIVGGGRREAAILTSGEYRKLADRLRALGAEPSDLLGSTADSLMHDCRSVVDRTRLSALVGRGFLLSQAVEHWRTRAIWVVSRADDVYPRILKERLGKDSPILLYGCGDLEIAAARGALAIVGSRDVNDSLIEYARDVAALSARAGRAVVSGGARGIDRAAMNGALEAGGKAVGVLAGDLERTSMNREHRNLLLEERLVLVSPYDPRARFNVGHAMQRNKVIYALAAAALVVNATADSGGTWAGAIEQLQKYRAPVYVRSTGEGSDGIESLKREGARPWPNPGDTDSLAELLDEPNRPEALRPAQGELIPAEPEDARRNPAAVEPASPNGSATKRRAEATTDYVEALYRAVEPLILRILAEPEEAAVIAGRLGVTKRTVDAWIKRLTAEGAIKKLSGPVRYVARQTSLPEDG